MLALAREHALRVGPLAALVLCTAVYLPGLWGDFIFDDGPNIVQNTRLHINTLDLESLRQAAFSSDAGLFKRPISMLTFSLNYYLTGLDPYYFKLANLIIHLLNGLGLFWLTTLILSRTGNDTSHGDQDVSSRWVALCVAAVWLVHPLNVTAVLYVVQRMTSLSATFVILGLLSYALARRRLERGQPGLRLMLLGVPLFCSLALLTKENGVLLPLYIGALELTLFRFRGVLPLNGYKLKAFFLLTVALPCAAGLVFVVTHPEWITGGYVTRDFTLGERLLTEARVLWLYVAWILLPRPSELGLFHDDVITSTGLLQPATTLAAVIGLLVVCSTAIALRRRAPLLAFATAWFLVGHALESSIIALDLVYEHRNYLPMYGPLLALVVLSVRAARRLVPRFAYVAPAVFATALAVVTAGTARDWSSYYTLRMALVEHHPDSARANHEAGAALAGALLLNPELPATYYEQARWYFERSAELNENGVHPLFGLILLNGTAGRDTKGAVEELAARLARVPLSATIIEPFRGLVHWHSRNDVAIPPADVIGLFEAALGNDTASAGTRATLLSILSSYHFNVTRRHQEAVSLALAAVEQNPTAPAHRLSLADLAIKLGNLELAKRELDAVRRLDTWEVFTAQVRTLAGELAQAGMSVGDTRVPAGAGNQQAAVAPE